jgi:DNA-binding CsgD family transcriptional regulator
MSSKNGTKGYCWDKKMAVKGSTSQSFVLKILAELGNHAPKPHQIKLIESLIFKVHYPHPILFHHKLSENERNCLLLAAKGKTIQQTAHLLSVKNSTVTTLRKRTLHKLGCRSIAHAVFVGLYYGCFANDYREHLKPESAKS